MDNLFQKLNDIFELFRYIFEDDVDVMKILSYNYEKELKKRLNCIPILYIPKVLEVIDMIYEGISCINMNALLNYLNKYNICAHFNSYEFIDNFIKTNVTMSYTAGLAVSTLLQNFKQIFSCIDKIVTNPSKYLQKTLNQKSHFDILRDVK